MAGLWLAYDTAARHHDLPPHRRQLAGALRRLSLLVGSGQASLDELPDACPRRQGCAGQAGFCCDVDNFVLRSMREPLSRGRAGAAYRWVGDFLFVRNRPRAGTEHSRASPNTATTTAFRSPPEWMRLHATRRPPMMSPVIYLRNRSSPTIRAFSPTPTSCENAHVRAPSFLHHVAPDETHRHGRSCGAGLTSDTVRTSLKAPTCITHTAGTRRVLLRGRRRRARFGLRPSFVLDRTTAGARRLAGAQSGPFNCWPRRGHTAVIADRPERAGQFSTTPGWRRHAQSSVPATGPRSGWVTLSDSRPILDIECRT